MLHLNLLSTKVTGFSVLILILMKIDLNNAKHISSSFHPSIQLESIAYHPLVKDSFRNPKVEVDTQSALSSRDGADLISLSKKPTILNIISIPRGGSLQSEDSQTENFVIIKIRNVIRSLLDIGDRKSPSASNLIRGTVRFLENWTGIELLPKKKKKSGKKKSKSSTSKKNKVSKRKKSSASSTDPFEKESTIEPKSSTKSQANESKKSSPSSSKPSKASSKNQQQAHLSRELKATNPNYRIQRELKAFISSPPPNLKVNVGKNIRVWIISMTGAKNTIYEGERYRLRVSFPPNYPTVPPSMYFMNPTPRHEHVYTNGDICLSLLGKDWRPTMTAQSLAMSILSILSSAREKSLPMDNARHAVNKPGQAQDDWVYHDDNC